MLTCSPPAIEENTCGIPNVRTRTPTICSIVVSRYTQSSVSYAEANQLKLIHAQLTEKVTNEKGSYRRGGGRLPLFLYAT